MAETAVILVIDKLALLLTEEANLLNGIEEEVDYIKDELESIRSFLKDADEKAEKEDNNNGIKTWVKQVREAAYDIEDIIDEYIIHFAEVQHCQHQGFVKFIHGISYMVRKIKPRRKIALQIQDMKTKLCEIKERSTRYGFNSWEQRSSDFMQTLTWCDPRMASYFVKGNEVVGVESARDELIGWLVAGGSERKVISVVGMGGLGKTTVAKIVYDNEKVAAYFECHAWITVSQLYSRNELLRNVIRQFCQTRKESMPEGIDAMDEFLLITKLRQYLQEKRYVVVFDDVWKVDFWGDIEHALLNNNNGSRIMITTRIKDVSDFCKKSSFVQVHELQPLPPNKAWELFCMKTFHFEFDGNCPLELQKLSHAIVERCGGLPLAIVAIGGLLSTKEKIVSEWKKLHDSLGSELEYNPHLTNITKILSLSYHDLPHYLKSCFLYLGIYPEDYSISHPTLTTQWIAEGFIKGKKGKTLEEVANEYLADLVRRNLVQKSWGEFNGVNKRYRIHDLTREIILSKFEELSFCHVLEGKDSSFSRKTRRLSILSGMCNTNVHTIRKSRARSLFLFNIDQLPRFFLVRLFENFKLLKVLDFVGAPFEVLPEEVGCLLHLSYLSVRATKIKVIPKSIGKLINLLTFDLSLTLVRELPIEITKLRKLRHLFAYFCSPGIDFCFDLLQGVRIHEGIGCLEKLQTLFHVEVNHGVEMIKELEKLTGLKVLGISNLTRKCGRTLCAAIEKMKQLKSLELIATNEDEILDLEYISSPPQLLWDLFLRGKLERLPKWIQQLGNLVTICLSFSGLTDDPLKSLEALPNLENVYLYGAFHGELLHIKEEGFQKLKLLSLRNLTRLNSVIIDNGALPHLEELHIGRSRQLQTIPTSIHDLTSLKTLRFFDMPKEFAVKLLTESQEYWKVEHIKDVCFSYRIVGGRYASYKLGDPNLLQHLTTNSWNAASDAP